MSRIASASAALFASVALLATPAGVPVAHAAPTPAAQAAPAPPCTATKIKEGFRGPCASQAQSLLKKRGYYAGSVDGIFGQGSVNATLNFQRAQALSDDGTVGPSTWQRLKAPRAVSRVLPDACYGAGTVLCASKAQRKLFFLNKGVLKKTITVRFGGMTRDDAGKLKIYHTVKGTYRVYGKDAKAYSERWRAAMPYSVMFNPNMYVHYSEDFAKRGYTSASHGCVNVGSMANAKWIFQNTPVGAKVIVF